MTEWLTLICFCEVLKTIIGICSLFYQVNNPPVWGTAVTVYLTLMVQFLLISLQDFGQIGYVHPSQMYVLHWASPEGLIHLLEVPIFSHWLWGVTHNWDSTDGWDKSVLLLFREFHHLRSCCLIAKSVFLKKFCTSVLRLVGKSLKCCELNI